MRFLQTILILYLAMSGINVRAQERFIREKISLEGSWKYRLDPLDLGTKKNWQDSSFNEQLVLPGSLEENKIGKLVTKPYTRSLNRTYTCTGPVWFQKSVVIPGSWKDKQLELFLERTKATAVWVDDRKIGQCSLLSAPHVYNLTGKLTPGKHRLTIRVDNSPALFPVGGSHAMSDDTQTNWNGILGEIYLEAAGNLKIKWIKIVPDVHTKMVKVSISVLNAEQRSGTAWIDMHAVCENTAFRHNAPAKRFQITMKGNDTLLVFSYPLGRNALLWSEYTPALYALSVGIGINKYALDTSVAHFGLREYKVAGTQFTINGDICFLRGKHDGGVFPLTGYPSMDTAVWRKRFRIAKSFGINHYRFHSYTPPEAAFEAADIEGIYIQAELPNWANFTSKDSSPIRFQYREGKAIFDAYGNHPSFVMFTLGNELGGHKNIHEKMVDDFRKYDNRRLYADGSNAFYNNPAPGASDDFWVTMRTGKESPDHRYDTRGSFACTEDTGSGIINSSAPSTRRNFSRAISDVSLPVIGHETGQFQVYPDFDEMSQYTGVLRPLNFRIFRERLENAGMGDQAKDFFRASGMLTALLYREEIEMALRTPGYAGFQLLDLQDYPGQGTALVGLLNAFMKNKGLIQPEEFRQFNNDVVIQLLMDKYTWTNNEIYKADIQAVNYSREKMADKKLSWKIVFAKTGDVLTSGTLRVAAEKGKINPLGKISFSLRGVSKAVKLIVELAIDSTSCKAAYPLWVYPVHPDNSIPANIKIATRIDDNLIQKLKDGARVILFPDHERVKEKSVRPQFISEFWNWLVFKAGTEKNNRKPSAGTLGILTDPHHPLFNFFPTEFYTNWQWWTILKNARPLILDSTARNYRPLVQVIDNIDRNHKLGIIFEYRVGNGKILVSMADLPSLLNKPEAAQLYYSMLKYAASDSFNPQQVISPDALKRLL